MRELLIGCGSRRDKIVHLGEPHWHDLVTLDINPDHKPDVIWNLEDLPYPFPDNEFDEIHAYEVLEHIGYQGNERIFFSQFSELWRILKPNGLLCASCPRWDRIWAWGDPSHKRIINSGTLSFLSQAEYAKQVGVTPMSDFRWIYKADFKTEGCEERGDTFFFILRAIKNA